MLLATAALLVLSGCAAFKSKPKTPVLGDRVPILASESDVLADKTIAEIQVLLPPPTVNDSWAQPGGSASKSNGQLALGANIENGHRNRCRKENRNVHKNCAQPAALRRPGGWMQKNAQKSKQQVGKVRHQMAGGLELDAKWKLAAPDCG